MPISNTHLTIYIIFGALVALILISQIIRYINIAKYKKRVKNILGENYASYFDWETLKDFYYFEASASDAALEMIAAGRCKPG